MIFSCFRFLKPFLVYTNSVMLRIGCLLACVLDYVGLIISNWSVNPWRAGTECPEKTESRGSAHFLISLFLLNYKDMGFPLTFRMWVMLHLNIVHSVISLGDRSCILQGFQEMTWPSDVITICFVSVLYDVCTRTNGLVMHLSIHVLH